MVFENKVVHPLSALRHALSVLSNYKIAREMKCKSSKVQKIWKAPDPGELKLNVDEAIFVERNKAGVGSVLRDAECRVIMAATKSEKQTGDPLEIELLAIFRGFQLCVPLGIENLKVESDSLFSIQAIDKGQSSCAQHSNLIKKMQTMFHAMFVSVCKPIEE